MEDHALDGRALVGDRTLDAVGDDEVVAVTFRLSRLTLQYACDADQAVSLVVVDPNWDHGGSLVQVSYHSAAHLRYCHCLAEILCSFHDLLLEVLHFAFSDQGLADIRFLLNFD